MRNIELVRLAGGALIVAPLFLAISRLFVTFVQ